MRRRGARRTSRSDRRTGFGGGLTIANMIEVRSTFRRLQRAPAFAFAAIGSIALGIAAVTAIFGFVVDVCWRPLPLVDPARLTLLWETLPNGDIARPSPLTFAYWSGQAQSFEQVAAFKPGSWALTADTGVAERIRGGQVTSEFGAAFRFKAGYGRGLLAGDFQAGGGRVAVLSYHYWARRFGSDQSVIGRAIRLGQVSYMVVGVLTPESTFGRDTLDVLLPLAPDEIPAGQRLARSFFTFGRLKPGVDLGQARAEMDTIAAQLAAALPATHRNHGAAVRPINEWIGFGADDRRMVLTLFSAVMCVQLIVCANLASLLLARALARRREFAVRAALGAGRRQIAAELLVEAVTLALVGGVLGLLLSYGVSQLLTPLMPALPMGQSVHVALDWRVQGFGLGASLLTGVLFGLIPAWQASRVDLNEVLKEGSRGGAGSRRASQIGGLLVVGEIAVAVVLVTAGGLIGQGLWRLGRIPLGFDPAGVGLLTTTLPADKYATDEGIAGFYGRVLEGAAALPGVRHVALASRLPLNGYPTDTFAVVGPALPPGPEWPRAQLQLVSPGYGAALGVPLLRGRMFSEQDRLGAPRVALINRFLAERFFPDADPVGRQLIIDFPATGRASADEPGPWQIVGVIGDVKGRGIPGEDFPIICVPFAQHPSHDPTLIVRAAGRPENLARALPRVVHDLDRTVVADRFDTMTAYVEREVRTLRHQTWLLGGFAAAALLLAALGIYGVMAYQVGQRLREFGIRSALGAQRADVLRLVLFRGLKLIVAGVGTGLLASLATGRLLETLLHGVSAFDPLTWAGAAVLLGGVALAACGWPARQAVRVDPAVALREE